MFNMRILFNILEKKRSKFFFIFTLLFTLVLAIGLFNLETDNDVFNLLPHNKAINEKKQQLKLLNQEFPTNHFLFIAVADAFQPEKLTLIQQLCSDLEALEVVGSIISPFNMWNFEKVGKTFIPIKLVKTKNFDQKNTAQLIDKLKNNRIFKGSIVSYDYQSIGFIVNINADAYMGKEIKDKSIWLKSIEKLTGKKFGRQKADKNYFYKQVVSTVESYENQLDIKIAGIPVYESKCKEYSIQDLFKLSIPAILIILVLLFFNFRTKRGIFLPLISIFLTTIWTLGLMGWLRIRITIVGIMIPPLIIIVGSSYTLHYLNSYYLNFNGLYGPRRLVMQSTQSIFFTILIASMTTISGFASFLISGIIPIRYFGLFVIISILFTVVFTFFGMTNMLIQYPLPQKQHLDRLNDDLISKILTFFRQSVTPLRYVWILIFVGAIVLFCFMVPRLMIETNVINFFRNIDQVKKDLIYVQKKFHGSTSFQITVRSKEQAKNFFKSRDGMLSAQKIQKYLDQNIYINEHKTLGYQYSLVSFIEDINYAFHKSYEIPDEKSIKKILNIIRMSDNNFINKLFNHDFSALTFDVRTFNHNPDSNGILSEMDHVHIFDKLEKDLQAIAEEDGSITVDVWGDLVLISNLSKYLVKDQMKSIIFTTIAVLIITLFIFRSLFYSLFSLIPMIYGVLLNFTIMALFKIPLDSATVLIAAISIGIGIDDAVHFIIKYRHFIRQGLPVSQAVNETLKYTARPILFTSLVLFGGFLIFLFSAFRPLMFFGILLAISMINCMFAALFILPSFFIVTDKIKQKLKKRQLILFKKEMKENN